MDDEVRQGDVTVTLTPDEVKFVMECILLCPLQVNVKSMPTVLGLAQGIIKKLQPPPVSAQEGRHGVSKRFSHKH